MNRRNKVAISIVASLFTLTIMLAGIALAAGETIPRWITSSGGGGVASSDIILQSAIGQPVAGMVQASDVQLCSGILCGDDGAPSTVDPGETTTPTTTVTPDGTPGSTPGSTPSSTPAGTVTVTVTVTVTGTPTGSITPTSAITPTGSVTPTVSATPVPGETSTPEGTSTPDGTPEGTSTPDGTPEGTSTPDASTTPTATATPIPAGAPEDVVLSEVYYAGSATDDWIELKNVGPGSVDISNWQLCARFSYEGVGAMERLQGDLTLDPGEIVVFRAWTDLQNASDLGLYINGNNFDDAANMVDFVQWGTPDDIGRSDVAVRKQIWKEPSPGVFDFVPTAVSGQSLGLTNSARGGSASDFVNGVPSQGATNAGQILVGDEFTVFLPSVLQ